MSDARGLAVQAVALRLLTDRVKQRSDEVKSELMSALDPGDRKTAALDDGTKVGSISYSVGRVSAKVIDERALADWVADHYPDEVVPQVRGSFLTSLLNAAKEAGAPVDPRTGEVLPGVDVAAGSPYLSVRPDESGAAALVDLIRANRDLALEVTG